MYRIKKWIILSVWNRKCQYYVIFCPAYTHPRELLCIHMIYTNIYIIYIIGLLVSFQGRCFKGSNIRRMPQYRSLAEVTQINAFDILHILTLFYPRFPAYDVLLCFKLPGYDQLWSSFSCDIILNMHDKKFETYYYQIVQNTTVNAYHTLFLYNISVSLLHTLWCLHQCGLINTQITTMCSRYLAVAFLQLCARLWLVLLCCESKTCAYSLGRTTKNSIGMSKDLCKTLFLVMHMDGHVPQLASIHKEDIVLLV